MIPGMQQGQQGRGYRCHAGGEDDTGNALLHGGNSPLQRGDGRIQLATVVITGALALKHLGQMARIIIAIGNRGMNGFMKNTMFRLVPAI